MNRQGSTYKSAVTCIKWIPGSENSVLCGFEDGSIAVFDKELEDQGTVIQPINDE
jgi:hypothetical protein